MYLYACVCLHTVGTFFVYTFMQACLVYTCRYTCMEVYRKVIVYEMQISFDEIVINYKYT